MDEREKSKLQSAYLQTNYIVRDGDNLIRFRIGERNAALDKLLMRWQVENWAYVTAYNPFSKLLPAEENLVRQTNLLNWLKEKKLHFLDGYSKSINEDWEIEPSFFIFEIERETALSLGREFEQNAIVIGQIGGVAELVWCRRVDVS